MKDSASAPDIEAWRRKLVFRSWHRGTREMDLLLGAFAEKHLPGFSSQELALYEELLKENDPDLYEWLTGKSPPPVHCQNKVMEKLQKFRLMGSVQG
jgi:antitoxin CptB